MAALDDSRSFSSVVFVNTNGDDYQKLPRQVREALSSEDAGTYIPKTVVFDSSLQKVAGVIRYEAIKADGRRAFSDAKDKLREWEQAAAATPKAPSLQPESWTSSEGNSLTATFITATPTQVTLRLQNGSQVAVPLDRLNEAGRKRVAELTASQSP